MRVTSARGTSGGWRFARTLACIAGLAIFLSGCLTVPTAQTDAMVAATAAIGSASDTLLGQLNAAEKQVLIRQTKPSPFRFDPDNAALYSTLDTYAPTTQHFNTAIGILKDYAALIKALVEGQTATTEANAIKTTIDNISTLAEIAPPFTAEVKAIDTAAGLFTPLVVKALTVRTQAEARDLVQQGAEPVRKTIAALKEATPAMFYMLAAAANTRSAAQAIPVDKARVALSDYVVLLGRLQATFDKLNDAFQHRTDSVTAVSLAQTTGELAADAKIVEQAFASLK